MSPSALVVSAAGDIADYGDLISDLRMRLRGWQVTGADGSIPWAEIGAIQALVVIVPADGVRFTTDAGIGQLLSQAEIPPETSIFPVLLPGARMPRVAELPEKLKWFHFINAISIGAGKIGETAPRLADAIRNAATLDEPAAPETVLLTSLRLGSRPMLVGPLWAAIVILLSLASAIALAIAVPWFRTTPMRLSRFMVASLWARNTSWGGFIGRRLGSWGPAAGAVIGAVLPWLPLGLASTAVVTTSIVSSLIEGAGEPYTLRVTGAALLGAPLAVGLTLLSAGRIAAGHSAWRDESQRKWESWQPLALGIAGLALGGSLGWTMSSGATRLPFPLVHLFVPLVPTLESASTSLNLPNLN